MNPRPLLIVPLLAACTVSRDVSMTPELSEVVDGDNAFSADLYGAFAAEEGNVFLSPFSVYSALGMTYAGANGSTADELRDVLYVGDDDGAFHENLGALTTDLNGRFEGYQIAIGNRLFGQKGLDWQTEFLDITADDYGAELQEEDFEQKPARALDDINGWVSKATKGHIDELLSPSDIDTSTRLVLTNAIWFKGDWETPFKEENTEDAAFTLADGSTVTVPTMRGTPEAQYGEFDGGKVLNLFYETGEIEMFAILPNAADGLPALEASLDGETLVALLDGVDDAEVDVRLPKLDLRQHASLNDMLAGLGMPTAFSPGADFSGMLADEQLYLSKAVHEAWVSVDEGGTEAAAATAIVVSKGGTDDGEIPSFVADHPFIFGIRDHLTGAILFMGRVADPTEE